METFMSQNKQILYQDLSYKIIGIAMRVHTKLGAALPEHCYSRSMALELDAQKIPYSREYKVMVYYNDQPVGHLIPDMVIDNRIVLETMLFIHIIFHSYLINP
jgi:GxxExxY protein